MPKTNDFLKILNQTDTDNTKPKISKEQTCKRNWNQAKTRAIKRQINNTCGARTFLYKKAQAKRAEKTEKTRAERMFVTRTKIKLKLAQTVRYQRKTAYQAKQEKKKKKQKQNKKNKNKTKEKKNTTKVTNTQLR